ncbi:MAG: alcohol dehydrogenase catalytic domain-containing protein [Candidatus Eisenbacteria bacterium]|nr:alcohol dehydrogenase catalytic domain-containing protein [Candidatus Eisenbacteria bacterium]
MRAVVADGKGGVRIGEVPLPRVPADGALVRVAAVGICGSDTHKLAGAERGTVLGHEVAGVVERIGPRAREWRAGDRIVVAHHVPCGRCRFCRSGHESQCALFRSTNLDPGGWAEFVAATGGHLRLAAFRIPRRMDEGLASLTEPLACCLRAVRRSEARRGETFVVVGLGFVGLLLAALLRKRGARVLGLDRITERTRFASRWCGAVPLPADPKRAAASVRRRTKGDGADQVLLAAGAAETFGLALDLVRRGGTVHLFSAPDEGTRVSFDPNRIYKREVRVLATYSSSPRDLRAAWRLIRSGSLPFEELITHRLPLDRIDEGLRAIRSGNARKVVLVPGTHGFVPGTPGGGR